MRAVLFSILLLIASVEAYCPDGWTFDNTTNSCLFISTDLYTFDEADNFCRSQNSLLATLNSYFDRNAVVAQASTRFLVSWIGARKGEDGHYYDIDDPSFIGYWLEGEPNPDGECVAMRGIEPSGMRALPCYSLQPAICKQPSSACNGGMYGSPHESTGNITSPNFPDHYFNNLDCQYIINSPPGTYITINFTIYDVEEYYDYVQIYDGNSTNSPLIGSIHYARDNMVFDSTLNQLLVRFITDAENVQSGWLAEWKARPPLPDVVQSGEKGSFTSPYYPLPYPNYAEQFYYITVLEQQRVNLTIVSFDTELGFDPLKIFDGPDINSVLLDELSGEDVAPYWISSTGNTMTLLFTSDYAVTKPGFRITWVAY